jgi:DNA invertase Pin-like site-specific DNA recombinase
MPRTKNANALNGRTANQQAPLKSIADPMIDTTSPHGKLILAVLAALSEFERSMILARTSEGWKRAQARPVLQYR